MIEFLAQYWEWSWPAAVLTLSGRWLLGKRRLSGWVVEIAAGLFWHYVAYTNEIWGQLVMSVILQVLNVRGLWLWMRKNGRT